MFRHMRDQGVESLLRKSRLALIKLDDRPVLLPTVARVTSDHHVPTRIRPEVLERSDVFYAQTFATSAIDALAVGCLPDGCELRACDIRTGPVQRGAAAVPFEYVVIGIVSDFISLGDTRPTLRPESVLVTGVARHLIDWFGFAAFTACFGIHLVAFFLLDLRRTLS